MKNKSDIGEKIQSNKKNNNDDTKNSESKSNNIILKRKSRYLVFAVILAINICINLDNGFIPAASDEIRKYLDINDAIFGLYGSLSFFGNLLGKF